MPESPLHPGSVRVIEPERPVFPPKSIHVVNWNIDRGTHLAQVVSELTRNPADLYLLQEVDWNTRRTGYVDVAAEIAHQLHLNLTYGVEFEELGQEEKRPAYTGQAILTRLPVHHARVLQFQDQSGFWKPRSWLPSQLPLLQRRDGNRIALIDEVQLAGRLLVVYNAHLESRSYGRIQDGQLNEILTDLGRYPSGTACLLGGDLNTKYLPSIFLHKLERAGFKSVLGERIERTHAIAMTLDWIFVKGPIDIKSGVVRKDVRGSDHYPIYAQLSTQ